MDKVLPVGTILAYGGSAAPEGFLLCEGQEVSRTQYASLFQVIGTSYGEGDGTTTFNIPKLSGISQGMAYPDYSNPVNLGKYDSNSDFTINQDGFVRTSISAGGNGTSYVYINDTQVAAHGGTYNQNGQWIFPVSKGDKFRASNSDPSLTLFKSKAPDSDPVNKYLIKY